MTIKIHEGPEGNQYRNTSYNGIDKYFAFRGSEGIEYTVYRTCGYLDSAAYPNKDNDDNNLSDYKYFSNKSTNGFNNYSLYINNKQIEGYMNLDCIKDKLLTVFLIEPHDIKIPIKDLFLFYKAFLHQRMNLGVFSPRFNDEYSVISIGLRQGLKKHFIIQLGFEELDDGEYFQCRDGVFRFFSITKELFNANEKNWDALIQNLKDEDIYIDKNSDIESDPITEDDKKLKDDMSHQISGVSKFQINYILEFLFRLIKWIFVNQSEFNAKNSKSDLETLKKNIKNDYSCTNIFNKLAFNDLIESNSTNYKN